jgi:arylsulfatase A-like enzyme/acetyl esterase/lipase
MTRIAFLIMIAIACALVQPISTVQGQEAKRPNILFIVVDDQSPFDLRIYNPASKLKTPTLDRLAKAGMVIDSAYHMGSWVGAVCTASRHMILSGRTVWHIPDKRGRTGNPNIGDLTRVPANLVDNTLPAIFNRAGYDTMRTCKNGNSYEAANKQFTVRRDATKRGGTDETGNHWHAEQVLDYLHDRAARDDSDPFLIYLGFSHPHDTRDGTPELLAKYGAVNHKDRSSLPPANPLQPRLPINYLPEHPFHHGQPGLRDEEKVSGVWTNRDERTIRNEIGRQFACVENIDIQIGRVLEKLESAGELENTYVVYTSDHGMAIGRHGLQGKQNLYEHTWRVPFIVTGPGIKVGRAPGNFYLLDTLATLCELAGIEIPSTNEGISFRSVLTGERQSVRDVLYGVYCGGTKPGMRCVKKGDWKLVQFDVLDGTVRETQLFNLAENPHEFLTQHHASEVTALSGARPTSTQINLAELPEHAKKLAKMQSLLLAEMRRLHDPYRFWNQPDDGLTSPAKRGTSAVQARAQVPERLRIKSKQMFAENDANGDGKLSRAEFPERLRSKFGAIDTNKDGFVTVKEDLAYRTRGRVRTEDDGKERPRNPSQPRTESTGERRTERDGSTRIERDIIYATVDGRPLRLDLYISQEVQTRADTLLPVIVWIHGGGWKGGRKGNGGKTRGMEKRGCALVDVEYRLSSEALFPAQVQDCKAAIRWIRTNADKYGFDPERIGVVGSSAGGHLSSFLGTTGNVAEFDTKENAAYSSRVQVVCDMWGPTDLLQMDAHNLEGARWIHNSPESPESRLVGGPIQEEPYRALAVSANPIKYIAKGQQLPPFLIVHGDNDLSVPPHQSQLLYEAGGDATLRLVKGGGHGLRDGDVSNQELFKMMADFFDQHLKSK